MKALFGSQLQRHPADPRALRLCDSLLSGTLTCQSSHFDCTLLLQTSASLPQFRSPLLGLPLPVPLCYCQETILTLQSWAIIGLTSLFPSPRLTFSVTWLPWVCVVARGFSRLRLPISLAVKHSSEHGPQQLRHISALGCGLCCSPAACGIWFQPGIEPESLMH